MKRPNVQIEANAKDSKEEGNYEPSSKLSTSYLVDKTATPSPTQQHDLPFKKRRHFCKAVLIITDSASKATVRNRTPGRRRQKGSGVPFIDPQQPALAVEPLNSVPYTGPPISGIGSHPLKMDTDIHQETASQQEAGEKMEADPIARNNPAMVFFPSRPAREEWDNVMAATKTGVGLTGTAAMGQVGPAMGKMVIVEYEETYYFRVDLPGVACDDSTFSCVVEPSGKVVIKGVTTGVKRAYRYNQVFEMISQNLSPPGPFSISFELPGPVDEQQFTRSFGLDGLLEGIVKKKPVTGV